MLPFELTKDTPYLALSGELWSVFYEYFNRNWSCYKGFLLYPIALHTSPILLLHRPCCRWGAVWWARTEVAVWLLQSADSQPGSSPTGDNNVPMKATDSNCYRTSWDDVALSASPHRRIYNRGFVLTSTLTHLPLDKMAVISQTLFPDAFSWMKSFVFWLKFQWSLFLRV